MPPSSKRRDRLVGLFVAGVVLLNPPLLDLFGGHWFLGVPSLYVYFFAVWAALIAGLAVVLERGRGHGDEGDGAP